MNRWLTLALIVAVAGVTFPARAQTPVTVVEIAASLHVLLVLSDGSVVALGENAPGNSAGPRDSASVRAKTRRDTRAAPTRRSRLATDAVKHGEI